MTLPAPALEHVCDLTVFVAAPLEAGQITGLNSRGRRRIIPITGGQVTGRITGAVLPGGADFQIVVSETSADLDARYLLALGDGSHVYVQNRALRRGSAEDIARLVRGEPVDPAAIRGVHACAGLDDRKYFRGYRRALPGPCGDQRLPRGVTRARVFSGHTDAIN